MKKGVFKSIYGRLSLSAAKTCAGESGQALPIVLGALALGIMVVAPFLNHATASVLSAQNYKQMMLEQYSAESGAEQAIWRLGHDDLKAQIPAAGNQTRYTLSREINDIHPVVTVTRTRETRDEAEYFEIDSLAGVTRVVARVTLNSSTAQIDSWQVEK